MNKPPSFSEIRWNSIVVCIQFVYDNYETIKNALSYFKNRNEALKIKYCPKDDFLEVLNVVLPISIFSCKVEPNFCTSGDVFKELITLKEKINELIPSKSKLAEVTLSQTNYRFSSTCDSVLAQLSFLLTQEGKIWWNAQTAENDRILAKLTNRCKLDKSEEEIIHAYDNQKEELLEKITKISEYLKLNADNASDAFLAYLESPKKMHEAPLEYWKSKVTLTIPRERGDPIPLADLCEIAIRVLTIPSSEALCERVFSQMKYVHNSRRNRLKEDILDPIINIRFNMKMSNSNYEELSDSDEVCPIAFNFKLFTLKMIYVHFDHHFYY